MPVPANRGHGLRCRWGQGSAVPTPLPRPGGPGGRFGPRGYRRRLPRGMGWWPFGLRLGVGLRGCCFRGTALGALAPTPALAIRGLCQD